MTLAEARWFEILAGCVLMDDLITANGADTVGSIIKCLGELFQSTVFEAVIIIMKENIFACGFAQAFIRRARPSQIFG